MRRDVYLGQRDPRRQSIESRSIVIHSKKSTTYGIVVVVIRGGLHREATDRPTDRPSDGPTSTEPRHDRLDPFLIRTEPDRATATDRPTESGAAPSCEPLQTVVDGLNDALCVDDEAILSTMASRPSDRPATS